jgi:DNA-binding XRE family transcriptional regulator
MRTEVMVATLMMNGKRYVLVPEDEYELLRLRPLGRDDADLPPLPEIGPDGTYPAIEYATVSLARKLILDRRRVGLSQAELARRAGIRVETLNRIERAKVSPSVRTVEKIDRALREAERVSLALSAARNKGRRRNLKA